MRSAPAMTVGLVDAVGQAHVGQGAGVVDGCQRKSERVACRLCDERAGGERLRVRQVEHGREVGVARARSCLLAQQVDVDVRLDDGVDLVARAG